MSEFRRCRGTWAYCDGDCSRCTTTATTQTSMVYLIQPTADVPEKNVGKLTDKEQRIFLAAMEREEKICKEIDEEWQEAYEESLVEVCREIERKVKKALWTN